MLPSSTKFIDMRKDIKNITDSVLLKEGISDSTVELDKAEIQLLQTSLENHFKNKGISIKRKSVSSSKWLTGGTLLTFESNNAFKALDLWFMADCDITFDFCKHAETGKLLGVRSRISYEHPHRGSNGVTNDNDHICVSYSGLAVKIMGRQEAFNWFTSK